MNDPLKLLIDRWRSDLGGTYRTWFHWADRLKNFRSIRRGIQLVVEEIESGCFGCQYRDSSLQTVVASIAEQRQMFRGADHAFLWKPKLRIPDIYEDAENQRAFGRFLDSCACCDTEEEIVRAIHQLDARRIKGLGPAAANLLYFLHPTLVCPFNTAIVTGYNSLTGAKVKLGNWQAYLAMRDGVIRLNDQHRGLLSNDLRLCEGRRTHPAMIRAGFGPLHRARRDRRSCVTTPGCASFRTGRPPPSTRRPPVQRQPRVTGAVTSNCRGHTRSFVGAP